MKKGIAILELILFLFILVGLVWTRFGDSLSDSFGLEMNTTNVMRSAGISIAILIRIAQIFSFIRGKKVAKLRFQIMALGLYLVMISTYLFEFLKWNIYVGMYTHFTIILLIPMFLGIIRILLVEKQTNLKKAFTQ